MCNLLSTASFGIALKFGLYTYTFNKTADFLIRELGLVECWPDTITCSGLQGQHCTFKAWMKMTSRLFVKLSWKLEVGADSMWERWGCRWEEKPLIWTPLHLNNCPPFRTRINYWEDQKGWIYYFNTHQINWSGPPSQQESDWRGLWFLIHVIWILNPEWSGGVVKVNESSLLLLSWPGEPSEVVVVEQEVGNVKPRSAANLLSS